MIPTCKIVQIDCSLLAQKMRFEDYCLIYRNEAEIIAAGGTETIEKMLCSERKIALGFILDAHGDIPDFSKCTRFVGCYVGNYENTNAIIDSIINTHRAAYNKKAPTSL